MKYIKVPESVLLTNFKLRKDGKETNEHPSVSFTDFIKSVLLTSPKITATDRSLGLYMEICANVQKTPPGSYLPLQDEAHEFLSDLARGHDFAPDAKFDLLPLVKAITSASPEIPVTPA